MPVRTHRRSLALGVVVAAIALLTACDAAVTSPPGLKPASGTMARLDTLGCLRGWVIIDGLVVCN